MFAALATVLGAVVGALTPRIVSRFAAHPESAPQAGPNSHHGSAPQAGPNSHPESAPRAGANTHPESAPRAGANTHRGSAPYAGSKGRPGARVWLTVVAGAGSFGLLALVRAGDPALPAFLAVAALGVPLAAVDVACLRLPDPLVAAAGLACATGLAAAALALGTPGPLLRALAAALCCAAGYAVLALLPRSRLGFGDVKLAAVLGLPLGWLGWSAVLSGLALAHLVNGAVALVLLLAGRAGRGTALPFGPALLAGALLAVPLA